MAVYATEPNSLIYYTQRNNDFSPGGACFPTSVAMALLNNGAGKVHPILGRLCIDDAFFAFANTASVGDQIARRVGIQPGTRNLHEWWSIQEGVCQWFLNQCDFAGMDNLRPYVKCLYSCTEEQITRSVAAGYMVVLATTLTHAGHVVCVNGYDDGGVYLADPYGDANTGYKTTSGANVYIKRSSPLWFKLFVNKGKARALFIHADLKQPI